MDLKPWNHDIKELRRIILKKDKIEDSKHLFLSLHAMVHGSNMSGMDKQTFEDELFERLDDATFRTSTNEKGRTIAYGMWHSTRAEDITMNILVAGAQQIFTDHWQEKINAHITDTGNAMNKEEILAFSQCMDMQALRNYRIAVGRKTREIVSDLTSDDMKRRFDKDSIQRMVNEGAVLNVEGARWLIDFWGRKNVAGILLMPGTRHHVVHLNESFRAKKKAKLNSHYPS